MPPLRKRVLPGLIARSVEPELFRLASREDARILDLGPVWLPAEEASICRFPPDSPHGMNDGGRVLAVTCFGLSSTPEEGRAPLFERIHQLAELAFFLDIKEAERNLEIPASLMMRGLARISGKYCQDFHKKGGLEGLLYEQRDRFAVLSRLTLLAGGLSAVAVRCLRG